MSECDGCNGCNGCNGCILFKRLIDIVKNVNALNDNGETPLHSAYRHNYMRGVRCLINAGADESIKNKYGYKPIDVKGHENDVRTTPLENSS